jgi:hypothetical protein
MHQENGEDGITRANNIVKRRKEIWREESLALLFWRVAESILACSCAHAGYFFLQKVAICNFFSFPFFGEVESDCMKQSKSLTCLRNVRGAGSASKKHLVL